MADILIGIKQFQAPAITGNFDVTCDPSEFGGAIPKAVLIFGGASDAAATVDARWLVGFATISGVTITQSAHWAASLNAVAATDDYSNWRNSAVLAAGNNIAFTRASCAAFIANGVRLNFDTVTVSGRYYTAVFLGGTDLEVASGVIAPSGTNVTTTVTPGFQADVVLMKSVLMNAASGTNVNQFGFGFGIAHRADAANYCVGQLETDAIAAGGRPTAAVYNNASHVWISPSTGITGWQGACNNFTSTQFDFQVTGTIGGDQLGWLALKFGGDATSRLIPYSLPTSTGLRHDSFGSPAFQPTFGLICAGSPTAYNTNAFDTALGASVGLGVFHALQQGSHNTFINPAADPSSTGEHTQAKAFALGSSTAVDAAVAAFDSMQFDGWQLNWTAAPASAHVGFALAIDTNATIEDIPSRVTQMAAVVGVLTENVVAPRVTQMAAVVGVRAERVMCDTAEADLWKITRTDGTVYRFTSRNRRMTFRGEVYTPCGSLTSSALQLSSEVGSTDNVDLQGAIFEGGITELDIWSGRFVGARVEIWRAAWDGSGYSKLVLTGTVGAQKFADQPFTFEVITDGEAFTQRALLQTVTPTCRFKTFDSRCSLDSATFVETGTVDTVVSENVWTSARRREFYDTTRGEADGYFTLGKLTWTAGQNNGISVDVKTFAAGGRFILEERMPYPILAGDTYSVLPGDDRTFETCRDKFNNAINFGGFHKLRGADDLNKKGTP